MYAGVPASSPGSPVSRADRASPKSVTRTRPSSPTSTLSGLKSRWTMPAACAAASPRPACTNTRRISRHGRGVSSQRASVAPSTSSIATNMQSRSNPTSWTCTTFGCERRAIAWASAASRSRCDARSTLSAMSRASAASRAT